MERKLTFPEFSLVLSSHTGMIGSYHLLLKGKATSNQLEALKNFSIHSD